MSLAHRKGHYCVAKVVPVNDKPCIIPPRGQGAKEQCGNSRWVLYEDGIWLRQLAKHAIAEQHQLDYRLDEQSQALQREPLDPCWPATQACSVTIRLWKGRRTLRNMPVVLRFRNAPERNMRVCSNFSDWGTDMMRKHAYVILSLQHHLMGQRRDNSEKAASWTLT